ncbi:uncharacterized protein LOC131072799 isoform X4 [Cryptomeria japonica]|uniref:uncharacterized protein LOC131072799 isoform X4 n=1 Tax=Cryptomeria japonica TaxID=3369 RepID=UPI0025AD5406|nr:uncharacterized protein LOC131072799 isoform X4 [Cryptomeria japonica]
MIRVVIMGCGGVGRQLIHHIMNTRTTLYVSRGIRIAVVGVCDSRSLILATGVPDGELSDGCLEKICHLKSSGSPLSEMNLIDGFVVYGDCDVITKLSDIAKSMGQSTGLTFVDCSASDETVDLLNRVLDIGCCVVLANKKPLTRNIDVYEKIASKWRHLRFESTVGAGLPVIVTLNRLIASGDPVNLITGALSGTLGYVMSELQGGKPFSEVVQAAKILGFTEPDPREDLSGMDVARKGLILVRLLGWRINLEDIEVESLFPSEMGPESMSVEDFLCKGLPTLDETMEERFKIAASNGNVIRYVCTIGNSRCKVGLLEVPASSPLGQLKGSDNLEGWTGRVGYKILFIELEKFIEIYSRCYKTQPLVIQGAGAGNDTTAAGVLADIVDLKDLFHPLD